MEKRNSVPSAPDPQAPSCGRTAESAEGVESAAENGSCAAEKSDIFGIDGKKITITGGVLDISELCEFKVSGGIVLRNITVKSRGFIIYKTS